MKSTYVFLVFFTFSTFQFLHSQNSVDSTLNTDVVGIWENNGKIISIYENNDGILDANITLKTFYTFYYDGIYPADESNNINLARIGNNLYTEYWEKGTAYNTLGDPIEQEIEDNPVFKVKVEKPIVFNSETAVPATGTLWLPKSNTTELSIDVGLINSEVMGYYVDDNATYEIRYWIVDMPYSPEKVRLDLTMSEDNESVFIDKYIKIGDIVYTSTMGLRTEIRNVKSVEPFTDTAVISDDDTILAFGEPYLELSDITNVDDAILFHNSIPRPPRDGRAKFVEPSIYKKLEQMTIEDFDNPYAPIH